jgi:hypothetical protein
MTRTIAAALTAFWALGAHAATVSLTLARPVSASKAAISVGRIDDAADLQKKPAVRHDVDLAQPLPPLRLEPGHWSLTVEGDEVWHQTQYITVSGDTGAVLEVWPRAFVSGKIAPVKPMPAEVLIRFEPAAEGAPASGLSTCPIAEGAFRCGVPAGALDLRVRSNGYIAHYFLGARLAAAETRDLGTLTFRPGQAITGRVLLPREFRDELQNVTVRAEPANTDSALLPLTAPAAKNGFFHIDGVTPGAWIVRARHPKNLHAEPVPLTVIAGADAQLARAMTLDRPRRIEIAIAPPHDPDGKRWHVEVMREMRPGFLEAYTQSSADTDGRFSATALPGAYAIAVNTGAGDEWHREDVMVGATDVRLHLQIPSRAVKGIVTLAGKPLEANLELSSGGASTSATSNAEGRFAATIRSSDAREWTVRVKSEAPLVERELVVPAPDGASELSIELAGGRIHGSVVDEEGMPSSYPLLRIGASGSFNVGGTEAGTFDASGFEPGTYTVQASGAGRSESDVVSVTVQEDGDSEPLRLVLKKQKALRGFVVSDFGPVPGAEVLVHSTDVPQAYVSVERTNAQGRFVAYLPPASREFDIFVASPGFSYSMDHAEYRDSVARARVDQSGGTITVRGRAAEGREVQIVHSGAILPAAAIVHRAGGIAAEGELILPRMEPGPYSACVVEDRNWSLFRATNGANGARCVSGVLPPHGTLTLDVGGGSEIAAR